LNFCLEWGEGEDSAWKQTLIYTFSVTKKYKVFKAKYWHGVQFREFFKDSITQKYKVFKA
jgi:hypothetical protein